MYLLAGTFYYLTHGQGPYAPALAMIVFCALCIRIAASLIWLSRSKILSRNLDYFLAAIQRQNLIDDFVFILLSQKDLHVWMKANAPKYAVGEFMDSLRALPSQLR